MGGEVQTGTQVVPDVMSIHVGEGSPCRYTEKRRGRGGE